MPIYADPTQNAPVLTAPSVGPQPAPQPSPDDMLDATVQLHRQMFLNQWQQIEKAPLPESHRVALLTQLQQQYDGKKQILQGQKQQLLAVRQLNDQGALGDDDALRASWRVVLPNDVEQIVAPKPRQINRGVPEVPSTPEGIKKVTDVMASYIDPLKGPINRMESWAGGGKIPQQDLIQAYHDYALDNGLPDKNAATQDVLNRRWDNIMQSDSRTRDTWDPNHPDILAMRPTGPLQKIMASSMSNHALPRTPLGQSVQNANQGITQRLRREEPSRPAYANELADVAPGESSVGTSNAVAGGTPGPTPPAVPAGRVRVKDKTGRIGTIPLTQRDAAIAAGYTVTQ